MQDKPQQAVEVFKFFDWAYKNGNPMAVELDYVPLPESVVKLIRAAWAGTSKDPAGKAIWTAR